MKKFILETFSARIKLITHGNKVRTHLDLFMGRQLNDSAEMHAAMKHFFRSITIYTQSKETAILVLGCINSAITPRPLNR